MVLRACPRRRALAVPKPRRGGGRGRKDARGARKSLPAGELASIGRCVQVCGARNVRHVANNLRVPDGAIRPDPRPVGTPRGAQRVIEKRPAGRHRTELDRVPKRDIIGAAVSEFSYRTCSCVLALY